MLKVRMLLRKDRSKAGWRCEEVMTKVKKEKEKGMKDMREKREEEDKSEKEADYKESLRENERRQVGEVVW